MTEHVQTNNDHFAQSTNEDALKDCFDYEESGVFTTLSRSTLYGLAIAACCFATALGGCVFHRHAQKNHVQKVPVAEQTANNQLMTTALFKVR